MSVGKWYIAIGSFCMGFGTPPAHLVARANRTRRNRGI